MDVQCEVRSSMNEDGEDAGSNGKKLKLYFGIIGKKAGQDFM